jgi:hypothetical protein
MPYPWWTRRRTPDREDLDVRGLRPDDPADHAAQVRDRCQHGSSRVLGDHGERGRRVLHADDEMVET